MLPWFAVACLVAGCTRQPLPSSPADAGDVFVPDAARQDAGEMVLDAAMLSAADAEALPEDAGSGDLPTDAGTVLVMRDAGPPPRCIGSFAEGVSLFSPREPLVLRAHGAGSDQAEVYAFPWRTSLGEIRAVSLDVTWHVEGDTVLSTELLPDARGRQLRVTADGDIFDMGGRGRDAALLIRACVANRCPATAGDGSPCRCAPEVCSVNIIAFAVPALEGLWEFTEDGEARGIFTVVQDGRDLTGGLWEFPLSIGGSSVQGGELGLLITGVIAADRRSLSGIVEEEDGEIIGSWSARRAD